MVAKRLSQAALPVLTLMALLYLDGNGRSTVSVVM